LRQIDRRIMPALAAAIALALAACTAPTQATSAPPPAEPQLHYRTVVKLGSEDGKYRASAEINQGKLEPAKAGRANGDNRQGSHCRSWNPATSVAVPFQVNLAVGSYQAFRPELTLAVLRPRTPALRGDVDMMIGATVNGRVMCSRDNAHGRLLGLGIRATDQYQPGSTLSITGWLIASQASGTPTAQSAGINNAVFAVIDPLANHTTPLTTLDGSLHAVQVGPLQGAPWNPAGTGGCLVASAETSRC
jgi:hypothetical protein